MPCVLSTPGPGKIFGSAFSTLLKWCAVGEEKKMVQCLSDFRKAKEEAVNKYVCVRKSVLCLCRCVQDPVRGVRRKWSAYQCLCVCSFIARVVGTKYCFYSHIVENRFTVQVFG